MKNHAMAGQEENDSRMSSLQHMEDDSNVSANDKRNTSQMKSMIISGTKCPPENNTSGANQMRTLRRGGVSDITRMRDTSPNWSNENKYVLWSRMTHDGQFGKAKDGALHAVENGKFQGDEVTSVYHDGYGDDEVSSPRNVQTKINDMSDDDRGNRDTLVVYGNQKDAKESEEEVHENIPAWVQAEPVNGYIQHPVAGYVMHPSFYDNPDVNRRALSSEAFHDGAVDGPLCPAGDLCFHVRNCFEVRVRMAVLSYLRHKISYRDVEHIWGVSRSTIHRRKVVMDSLSPVSFLITPVRTTN